MIVLEAHGRESGHAGWRGGRRAVMAAGAVAVFVFAVACGGSTKSAAPAGPVVDVTALDNSWNPDSVTITPGSTVKWTNKGKLDHNIIPNGGDTKFGVDTANFGPGKTHEFTFAKAGEYKYYCSLHGTADAGMVGKIVVTDAPTTANTGTTAKTSGTRPGNEPGEIRKVPADFKTIQAGVDAAKPGDMVLIDKGVYHEAIKVKTDNIVIRGVDRNDTVLDGEYKLDNGFLVAGANGVAIENMTAKNYAKNGFFWTGVQGYRGSYLTAIRAGDYGVYAFDSRYGQLDHIMGTGSPDAGVYIGQCYPCDALITDVSAEYNGLGYSGTNSGGNLVIVNSTFRFNRGGIVPNTGSYEKLPPERESTIIGNTVYGNSRGDVPGINAALLVHGNGIMNAGGIDNVIERNLVFDHDKGGIVVMGFPDGDKVWDVTGNKIKDNVVSDSRVADLAMVTKSGEPMGNCFAGNTFTTSSPNNIEKLAPCTGTGSGDPTDGSKGLAGFISNQNPPDVDFHKMPDPAAQPTMPNATTAPWVSAAPANLPTIKIDLAAITVPKMPAADVVAQGKKPAF